MVALIRREEDQFLSFSYPEKFTLEECRFRWNRSLEMLEGTQKVISIMKHALRWAAAAPQQENRAALELAHKELSLCQKPFLVIDLVKKTSKLACEAFQLCSNREEQRNRVCKITLLSLKILGKLGKIYRWISDVFLLASTPALSVFSTTGADVFLFLPRVVTVIKTILKLSHEKQFTEGEKTFYFLKVMHLTSAIFLSVILASAGFFQVQIHFSITLIVSTITLILYLSKKFHKEINLV